MVKRTFRLFPNAVCIDYKNIVTSQQLLRALTPEAIVTINGNEYNVGGLYGQKEKAYLLPEWIDDFYKEEKDFQFINYKIDELKPFINWKADDWWTSNKRQPQGKVLSFLYKSNLPELMGLEIKVNYAIYDGLPLISKWVTFQKSGK